MCGVAQVRARFLGANLGHWKWSSYRYYALQEAAVVEIESEWLARNREVAGRHEFPPTFLHPS